MIPTALSNDNWYGYVSAWIYEAKVTWMDHTVASPYWTITMLFFLSSGRRGQERKSRRQHLFHDAVLPSNVLVALKGQLYSAPMDWASIQQQIESMERKEVNIALPITGALLEARVRLSIASGLVDLNKYIREEETPSNR